MIRIIIPTRPEDVELAKKSAKICKARSGVECQVQIIVDHDKKGWIAIHNEQLKQALKDGISHYVYGCADYYPGLFWLRIVYEASLHNPDWKLIGFNDGKWRGDIATVGMVDVKWASQNYEGGGLFYKEFTSHYGDTDLTYLARDRGEYGYCSTALYVEIDYEKDYMHNKKKQNPDDIKIWMRRSKERIRQGLEELK